MAKRHDDALYIQEGASNPSGIALTLIEAIKECRAEGGSSRTDPAVRLITHQLTHLLGMWIDEKAEFLDDTALYHQRGGFVWSYDYDDCLLKASDSTIETLKLHERRKSAIANISMRPERIERAKEAEEAAKAAE
jgi:hypothetical protein